MIILPPMQPPEKKKSYKELREEQLAAEAAAKKAAEPPEVRKVLVLVSTDGVEQKLNPLYKPGINAYLNPQITDKLICPSLGCIWSIYDFIFM